MVALQHIWVLVTEAASSFFSYSHLQDATQIALDNKFSRPRPEVKVVSTNPKHPVFTPPGSNVEGFSCHYPVMPDFVPCGSSEDRSCWLRNPKTGEEYNITTDYEDKMPIGIDRYYTLNVTDGWINANGLNFTEAKLYNNTFPGPLIEACWGDRVIINVTNFLNYNGTSTHWHGIRQNQTMHMDGVNGLTQCPMAPLDYFVYNWTATQYGSSWYHSHYTVQYADGLQAPIVSDIRCRQRALVVSYYRAA